MIQDICEGDHNAINIMIFVYAPFFKKLAICQFNSTTCDR